MGPGSEKKAKNSSTRKKTGGVGYGRGEGGGERENRSRSIYAGKKEKRENTQHFLAKDTKGAVECPQVGQQLAMWS